jgi:hypothetical protein
MKKIIFIAVPVVLIAVASVFAGLWYTDNKCPNFTKDHVLYVYPDMTADQVLESLDSVTVRPKSLARAFGKMETASKIKP